MTSSSERQIMIHLDDIDTEPMKLLPTFNGETFQQTVNYPIIVESWEKAKRGRGRREYFKQFTESERRLISDYHAKFYVWHLKTGTPDNVSCRLSTIALLTRAVDFFASI